MDLPKVDIDKCMGCEACVAVCPDNAIIIGRTCSYITVNGQKYSAPNATKHLPLKL